MNELISFLTSKEIIVVYIVAAIACILCFIIYLIDKSYYKRKQRHNTKELNKLVETVNEMTEDYEEVPVKIYETPILETIEQEVQPISEEFVEPTIAKIEETKPIIPEPEEIENLEIEGSEPLNIEDIALETMVEEIKTEENRSEAVEAQEELEYTTIEPNRQQAQEELMRLTEELEKAEQEQRNIDLTAYEEEQEENAIISLEELVKKSKEMYESNEYNQYIDEGNEPISLEDLERRMKKIQEEAAAIELETPIIVETLENEPTIIEPIIEEIKQSEQMVLDDFNTIKITEDTLLEQKTVKETKPAYQSVKKFERSPVISPIYGIERKETTEEIELENTANYDKLDEEIKKTNEFLMTLRELQKNLD